MTILLRVCVLGIMAVAPLVHAGTLATYVFSGTANGSIGAQTFTNATLKVTGIADIQNIENESAFSFNEVDFLPGAASLTISGSGSGTFTNLVYIVGNYGTGVLLLGGLFPTGNADIITLTDADLGSQVFANYFLNTSIGPIGPAPVEAIASWHDIPTTLGNITVTSYADVTFQATVVPEPVFGALPAFGLLAVVVALRKARRGFQRELAGIRPFSGTRR